MESGPILPQHPPMNYQIIKISLVEWTCYNVLNILCHIINVLYVYFGRMVHFMKYRVNHTRTL